MAETLRQRFERFVVGGAPDECWTWTAGRNPQGYGYFSFKGRTYRAHRVALTLAKPQPSPGLYACHTCDNPSCVNPAHLWWGTHVDNQRDKWAKGRGVTPFPVKLDGAEVRQIRELAAAGMGRTALAEKFGVTTRTISRIKWRRSRADA